ncbi:MAG TPA: SMI1/KNR4 family protein [Pyrinomonadaceae bacterium]|jgi:hypothetical protein
MAETTQLVPLLRAHEGSEWKPEEPAPEEELVGVERKLERRLQEAYRQLFPYADGGSLHGAQARIFFYPLRDLPEFNTGADASPGLAGMLVFADDEGDFIYYFDPDNRLRRGAWAVYVVEKALAGFEHSMFVAEDVVRVCRRVLDGENIFDAPYVGDESQNAE